MLDQLEKLVDEEKWEEARSLISKLELELTPSERFAKLNAMVYMEEGRLQEAHQCITVGIICNPSDFALYYLLGNYYLNQNINQAYLCYEQALFYCSDQESREMLEENMEFIRGLDGFEVHPVSFVIPSFNASDVMQGCIESIRKNHAESMYELVVVDNGSTDGVAQWLGSQEDVVLQCNDANEGFVKACNQGVRMAAPENDIFLLNNDTIVPPNALFWLRMGLYARETVGAVGPVSNFVAHFMDNNQTIHVEYETEAQYLELAESIHIPMPQPYENKVYLAGFALLVKRRVWNEAGCLDESFEYGWEDVDYGMTLSKAGYECLYCTNAFIYHYGGRSMACLSELQSQNQFVAYSHVSYGRLIEKWGIYPHYYMGVAHEMFKRIQQEPEDCFRVLEVGCGCGTTLSHIRWRYPNARVYGVELVENVVKLGTHMAEIIAGDIETMELPYAEHMFDYIIFGDVLEHLRDPQKVVVRMRKYLRADGKIIASIPNLLNKSVIAPLLRGKFNYAEAGLLDRTHIHLFTKQEICNMFSAAGYEIMELSARLHAEQWRMEEADEAMIDAICQMDGVAPREEFEAYQYQVVAKIK